MKFLAVSLLALTTIAAPTAKKEDARDALLVRAQAVEASLGHIKDLQASGCSIIKCVTALAPTFVGCGAAAAQEFVDPVSDLSCIASAANAGVNPPSSCVACFDEVKNKTGLKRSIEEDGRMKVYLHI